MTNEDREKIFRTLMGTWPNMHQQMVTSHVNNPEVLLIRISHWLWKWYRESNRPRYLDLAIQDMARVKEEYRAPRRVNRLAQSERMRAVRGRQK